MNEVGNHLPQVLLNGVQIMTTLVIVGVLEAVSWNPNLNTILVQSLLCSSKALKKRVSHRVSIWHPAGEILETRDRAFSGSDEP